MVPKSYANHQQRARLCHASISFDRDQITSRPDSTTMYTHTHHSLFTYTLSSRFLFTVVILLNSAGLLLYSFTAVVVVAYNKQTMTSGGITDVKNGRKKYNKSRV